VFDLEDNTIDLPSAPDRIALEDTASKIEIIKTIGYGSAGQVYCARHVTSGFIFAVKSVNDDSQIAKEIRILQKCRHANIVQYYGSRKDDNQKITIFIEYCVHGSLSNLMSHVLRSLESNEIAAITEYVLRGLEYLHGNKIVHRDLKPENILISKNFMPKIADFGVATSKDSLGDSVKGTPVFLAPEVLSAECPKFSEAGDIWALGVCVFFMAAFCRTRTCPSAKPLSACQTRRSRPHLCQSPLAEKTSSVF